MAEEKKINETDGSAVAIPKEVKRIIIETDTLKSILSQRYGRKIFNIVKSEKEELWFIAFED